VLKSLIAARGCGYWAERGAAKMQQLVAQQLQISRRQGCLLWFGLEEFDSTWLQYPVLVLSNQKVDHVEAPWRCAF